MLMARRRCVSAVLAAVSVTVVVGATAWACVSGPTVELSANLAMAGDEIMVLGSGFGQPHPVDVRFDALDGPVIATLEKPTRDRTVAGTVIIPVGTTPGDHIFVFSQSRPDGTLSQLPIRVRVTVVGPGGERGVSASALPLPEERPVSLDIEDNSVTVATLALVTVGVAGVGILATGAAVLISERRGPPMQVVSRSQRLT